MIYFTQLDYVTIFQNALIVLEQMPLGKKNAQKVREECFLFIMIAARTELRFRKRNIFLSSAFHQVE